MGDAAFKGTELEYNDGDWALADIDGRPVFGRVGNDGTNPRCGSGRTVGLDAGSSVSQAIPIGCLVRNLGPQPWEEGGLAEGLGWNGRNEAALEAYPVDRARLVEDTRKPWPWEGPYPDRGRVAGAIAVIDEACLSRGFLKAFEERYDPDAEENRAIHEDEPWEAPAFDFYGDNFYTLDGFALALEDLAAGPEGDASACPERARGAWAQALALLRRVLEVGRALEEAGKGSFGILVVGP